MDAENFLTRYYQLVADKQIEDEFIGLKIIRLTLKHGDSLSTDSTPYLRRKIMEFKDIHEE
ncbi:MAG: hypothetical protein JXR50_06315 [Prolixibacteraceae bacterium]|nr:hypothetical protein [Prolixibacteraceae bacterium]